MDNQDSERIIKIKEVCEKYGIKPEGNVFCRTAEDVEKIILLCLDRGINAENMKMVFRRNLKDVEAIFDICDKHRIPVDSILFDKKPHEISDTVKYISETFGRRYATPTVLSKDLAKLKESMPYISKLGLLPLAIKTPSVLELSEDEFRERTALLLYLGMPIHRVMRYSHEDKLNLVYSYSKEKFAEFLDEQAVSDKVLKYQTEKLKEREESFEKQ